ncbi:PREDICTED: gamma-crystallin A-like, partial [Apaloderma vittatum]|uniref:gamma-crystallin A-like n=1 Tax=Apaloderma vittatum TaxID=57397 RepID=UPI000521209C
AALEPQYTKAACVCAKLSAFTSANCHNQESCYKCSNDHPDLQLYMKQCTSTQVEIGCWMIYEHSSYISHKHFPRKRKYPDHQH